MSPIRVEHPPLPTGQDLEYDERDIITRGPRLRGIEAGHGDAVFLLHDVLKSHVSWASVTARLADKFRVIAFDWPGFGRSEKSLNFSYDYTHFVDVALDAIAAFGESRVHVVGHGLGGAIAIALARAHPASVRSLSLVNPHLMPAEHWAFGLSRSHLFGRIFVRQVTGTATFRSIVGSTYYQASALQRARADQWYAHFNSPEGREAAWATLRTMNDTRALLASLPRISVPSMVLWGQHDTFYPLTLGKRAARELRSRRFELFDVGHSPPEENPDATARALAEFFAE
jgi:pimeloyl-ACP methyl ester carboxylesterase